MKPELILLANMILYCRKWRRTVAFYRDILKRPVTHENDWFVEFQLTESARIAIADAARTTLQSADGKGITLSFQVKDVDTTRRLLHDAGVEVSEIRDVWGSRACYLHDPEGHRIEFWS